MAINEMNIKMERANRIAVLATDTGYKADFYRTHKHLATLFSAETAWTPAEDANKTAQREDFRQFAIEHSADIGIEWKPEDLRTAENKRIAKYESDEALKTDAENMLFSDLYDLVHGLDIEGLEWGSLVAEAITPTYITAKGTDLAKMGVENGKYLKSGNWAWATVEMVLILKMAEQEIYYTTACQLVSGQLKKPHITKTAFAEDVHKSLLEAGLINEESKEAKAEESAKAEDAPAEESKPKKTRKSKKTTDQ